MAARTNKINHDDKTKRLIRASQLLNRLNDFANGKIEMTQAQVNAARTVIAKDIPDLKAIELSGPDGGSMRFELLAPWLKQQIAKRNS